MSKLVIIGGGLAGSEAAWQAAKRGIEVDLFEMRPEVTTGAHASDDLAELVCSNSLGSNLADRAAGLLKNELRRLGSLLIECADLTSVPAGGALAVDRGRFSRLVTERVQSHPKIRIVRKEYTVIPEEPAIIATGPLTSSLFSGALTKFTGEDYLYFFDAISPIISRDSIDMSIAFRASRYQQGLDIEGDYINCPMTKEQYDLFLSELFSAERIPLKSFEAQINDGVKAGLDRYFEGCLPIEVIAGRGHLALTYGPMRPVGIVDPNTGSRPFAVVQLRQDNVAGSLYNIVGFQTNLKFSEQKRVFRLIPGLEEVEFVRYGQIHRNTFISSPRLLKPTLQFKSKKDLYCAGQITGVEGYAGNIATGLLAGWNATRTMRGDPPLIPPETTLIGALCNYITHADPGNFQPMKANFGILPPLDGVGRNSNKRQRAKQRVDRSMRDLDRFLGRPGIDLQQ